MNAHHQPPLVSVIIPTYNRSHYLCEAIASVLVQTYRSVEIVVVDDGSFDDTPAVLAGFNDSRIVALRQVNAGRSQARNHGLLNARGEYIAFLDDDDLYLPHKLAAQVAYLETHPAIGLVAGGAHISAANGSLLRTWETWKDQPQLELPGCLYACPLLTCAVLFRRRWLDALAEWFDPALERAEDTDFWLRLLVAGCEMAWLPAVVSVYRSHDARCQGDDERYYHSYMKMLAKLYTHGSLPAVLLEERSRLYAHYHTVGACQAYAAGKIDAGQERLLQAALAMPEHSGDGTSSIVASLVGAAQSEWPADPVALLNLVFDKLPQQLVPMQPYRSYALSMVYMQRVFSGGAIGERGHLNDWRKGVGHNPRWLKNRGVWSLLVRRIIGPSFAAAIFNRRIVSSIGTNSALPATLMEHSLTRSNR